MSEDVFLRYGAYYDLLYRDKDYAGEAAYVVRTLRVADAGVRKVLEFGSGTGRHGRLLSALGLEVLGVERSEAMVAAARGAVTPGGSGNSGRFDCMQGDICSVDAGQTFDAVVALFHVISYVTCNEDVMQTFRNAARHLRPRGVFFFDVWHGPAVLSERPSVRVKRVEDAGTRLIRIAEPELDSNGGVVTVHYTMLAEAKVNATFETFQEEHRMRYFFPTEIELLATQSGFRVERCEEFFTGHPVSENTWGVAYVLRKCD